VAKSIYVACRSGMMKSVLYLLRASVSRYRYQAVGRANSATEKYVNLRVAGRHCTDWYKL